MSTTVRIADAPLWWRTPVLRIVVTALVGTAMANAAGLLAAGAAARTPQDHPAAIAVDMQGFQTDLAFYRAVTGDWPATLAEVYGGAVPVDPWGHAYAYVPAGADHSVPDVVTLGADGVVGGLGANADRTMSGTVGALALDGAWDVGT